MKNWIPHPGPQTEAFRYFYVFEILYGGAKGGGKAQPLTASVLTKNGFKKIGLLKIGDKVLTPNGKEVDVIGIFPQGKKMVYSVEFIDGAKAEVCIDHLWKYKIVSRKNKWRIDSTAKLIEHIEKRKKSKATISPNILIPLISPVEFTKKHQEINPYVLGYLLGDGTFGKWTIRFSTADNFILEKFKAFNIDFKKVGKYDYLIVKNPALNEYLRRNNLWHKRSEYKFIPHEYIQSSISDRKNILSGLLDSDGYVDSRGHIVFSSVSEQLAKDAQWIVRSLGGKATIWRKESFCNGKQCLDSFNVYIGIEDNEIISLPRKKDRLRKFNGGIGIRHRRLKTITPIGEKECVCIKVDSQDGLYITDDFIVTHNTDWLLFDFLDPKLLENPNYRGIIFRRTFPRLQEIIDRSFKWFSTLAEYNKQEKCWVWPSGAKLFFRHCQTEEDKYDYQGHEYQYMGFDQLEEFTKSQYEFLCVQARTTDMDIPVRLRATSNPGNIGHLWVKKRFIDNKQPMIVYKDKRGLTRMFIPAKIYDNPSLMENDPTYISRLENLPEHDRKALLDGDWNIFSGQYFSEWTPEAHIIKPFHIPVFWKRFIAGDYGHKKPASIGWYVVRPEGGIVRYREIYLEGLFYDTLAEMMCELSADEIISYAVFDPAVFGDKQHHAKTKDAREGLSGAEIMQAVVNEWYRKQNRENDNFLITRGDNRRIEGWRNLTQALRVDENKETDFQVFSTCTHFITTFPANVHDELRPEDLDTNGEDHTADEARYAIMSRPPKTEIETEKELSSISPLYKLQELQRRRKEAERN